MIVGVELLKSCRWFRRLCYFCKTKNYGLPGYLFKLIPHDTRSCNTHFSENVTPYYCWTYTPHALLLNRINQIYNVAKLLMMFLKTIHLRVSTFVRSTYNVHNPSGMRRLNRLRLWLSHLNEHRFNHIFWELYKPSMYLHTRGCVLITFFTMVFFRHYLQVGR